MKRNLLSILAFFCFAVCSTWAQGPTSGNCGKDGQESDVTWTLTSDGTLTISGTGDMRNYSGEDKPGWQDALISRIVIRDGVTRVGNRAFYQCNLDNSATVTIGKDVTHIGVEAFYGCSTLSTVILGAGVTDIQGGAFAKCSSLTWFSIPASVTFIGTGAFQSCTSLADVYCYAHPDPDPLKFYWDLSGSDNFIVSPKKATKFHVFDADEWGSFADINVTFVDDLTTTPAVVASGDCSRDDGISSVKWTLTTDGVLTISGTGKMANYSGNDHGWESSKGFIMGIVIENGVTIIGTDAFQGCRSLSSVTIGTGVTDINGSAFQNCSNLTTLTIPANVTFIGADAFRGCTSLADVYCYAYPDPDPLKFYWRDDTSDDFIVSPKKATKFHVFDVDAWSDYADINVTFVGDLTPMITVVDKGNCGTTGNESDVTWTLTDDGVMTISGTGEIADYISPDETPWYSHEDDIKSVVIEDGVTYIGDYAFYACHLATATLNSNPYIGGAAFPDATTVTMNLPANEADGAKWMTFCNNYANFQADDNTQVFQAELVGTTLTLREIDDKIVNAGEAVILKSTGDPVMTMTTTDSSDDYGYNSLIGVSDRVGRESNGDLYVLNNGANGVGFYRLAAGKTLGYGKACLYYDDASLAPLRDYFEFLQDEDATGIQQMETEAEDYGTVYDLQGRPVTNPAPGIYIVNGKKVFIK
ncbi:MAG: leucine-rich repeat protein [Bacteroidaceae bacterium]|nr:leucine-rich repeat protein [Bacteroidaceae bacterium]